MACVLRYDDLQDATIALQAGVTATGRPRWKRVVRLLRRLVAQERTAIDQSGYAQDRLAGFLDDVSMTSQWDTGNAIWAIACQWDNWAPSFQPFYFAMQSQLQLMMNYLYDEGVTETDTWPGCPRAIRGGMLPIGRGQVLGRGPVQIADLAVLILEGSLPGRVPGPLRSPSGNGILRAEKKRKRPRPIRTLEDQYAAGACEVLRRWVTEVGVRNAIFSLIARLAPKVWNAGYHPILLLEAASRV